MFLDAPAVLALTTSPRLPPTAPLLFIPAEERLRLCSNNEEPWKADFCTDRKKGHLGSQLHVQSVVYRQESLEEHAAHLCSEEGWGGGGRWN